jgi:hypothetical protein
LSSSGYIITLFVFGVHLAEIILVWIMCFLSGSLLKLSAFIRLSMYKTRKKITLIIVSLCLISFLLFPLQF